jgi:hypothetical protein
MSSDAYPLCRIEGTPRERGRNYDRWIREPLRRFLDEELYTLGSAICLRYRWGWCRVKPPPVLLAERASGQFLVAPRHCYARTVRGIPEPRV